MNISDFDYDLPSRFIAQTPIEPRDASRLLVLNRSDKSITHRHFHQIIDYLDAGDMLVFNNSRVIPARLHGHKQDSSTKVELLLLRRLDICTWETLVKPGKKVITGDRIIISDGLPATNKVMTAEVIEHGDKGIRTVRLSDETLIDDLGQVPLPPYIHTPLAESQRYQTVYAMINGSVAAPTAGLHFTPELLERLQRKGILFGFVTLHIGLDTFRPIQVDDPSLHPIHTEYGEISEETVTLIYKTKQAGKRVIPVGTSTVRLLEAASQTGNLVPFHDWIDLFIMPGYEFRITDAMITNFHLPRSTLLLLVSAFASKDFILQSYEQAKAHGYRFFSFGDCMFIS